MYQGGMMSSNGSKRL